MKFYSPGSIVKLNSGGPEMTIIDTFDEFDGVECCWFIDGESHRNNFFIDCLTCISETPYISDEIPSRGSVVSLVSGGPKMTVTSISWPQVNCEWFHNNILHIAELHVGALIVHKQESDDTSDSSDDIDQEYDAGEDPITQELLENDTIDEDGIYHFAGESGEDAESARINVD